MIIKGVFIIQRPVAYNAVTQLAGLVDHIAMSLTVEVIKTS